MNKTILLFSGWQTINIGDIGHTPGTLRYLEQFIPEARVVLWLAKTNEAVSAMLKQRFPKVEHVSGGMNASGKASTPELQAAFDACNLLIQNSGMHYNRFWKPSTNLLEACVKHGKPIGLYGQSFDGLAPEDEARVGQWLSRAGFIFCRDNQSLNYLRQIDIQTPALEFGPDGCFGIDVRDDARAQEFLKQHQLEPKKFITVTIRTNTPKLQGGNDVLNPRQPSPEEQAQDEHWAASLREVIAAWVQNTGLKVLLVPEVDKEIAPAKRLLLDMLPDEIKAHVVHRDTFWNVDEAASVYANAHTVISMEPHSCIIALANGTPTMHLFSRKHGVKAWMFRDIGLPEWLLDIDESKPQLAVRQLSRIHVDYELAQNKVRRAMSFVNTRSGEMMREARRLIML
jgi:polysaccharide pyruvyl transferase WcaK-like protein